MDERYGARHYMISSASVHVHLGPLEIETLSRWRVSVTGGRLSPLPRSCVATAICVIHNRDRSTETARWCCAARVDAGESSIHFARRTMTSHGGPCQHRVCGGVFHHKKSHDSRGAGVVNGRPCYLSSVRPCPRTRRFESCPRRTLLSRLEAGLFCPSTETVISNFAISRDIIRTSATLKMR